MGERSGIGQKPELRLSARCSSKFLAVFIRPLLSEDMALDLASLFFFFFLLRKLFTYRKVNSHSG